MTVAPGRRRPVLVTGASSGIGEAVAGWLHGEGFRVIGTVRRETDAHRLGESGIESVRLDVTDAESIDAARAEVRRLLDGEPLFGLVNNAGIPSGGPLEHLPIEEFRRVLDVNAVGALAVTQAFLPDLRRSRGRIVMMSSVSGRVALPFVGPYAASKWALEAISDALRRELSPDGIRVIVIQPGAIDTPIWDRVEEMDLERYGGTPYEGTLRRLVGESVARGRSAIPPARVAEAVARALVRRRPRLRHRVVGGADRWLFGLLAHAPDRVVDRFVARRVARHPPDSP